jgi:hypothetical protein
MESNYPIDRGTRYRELQATVFGQPQPEWIVEGVFKPGGIEHARLVAATDSGKRKTLSLAVLRDRRRFERVEG